MGVPQMKFTAAFRQGRVEPPAETNSPPAKDRIEVVIDPHPSGGDGPLSLTLTYNEPLGLWAGSITYPGKQTLLVWIDEREGSRFLHASAPWKTSLFGVPLNVTKPDGSGLVGKGVWLQTDGSTEIDPFVVSVRAIPEG